MNITLSTKAGYPSTFVRSAKINVEGYDSFMFIDFSRSFEPHITLVGFTISAYKTEPVPSFKIGDTVTIGNVEYEIQGPDRFLSNSNIKLVAIA